MRVLTGYNVRPMIGYAKTVAKLQALPTIYIPIEVKSREYLSQLFLGAHLAEHGLRTVIGSKAALFPILAKAREPRGGLLYKGGIPSSLAWVRERVEFIAVMDQELTPVSEPSEDFCRMRAQVGDPDLVDAYLFSNLGWKEAHERAGITKRAEQLVTGWPRIDTWHRDFADYYRGRLAEDVNDSILYCSSFGVEAQREGSRFGTEVQRIRIWDSLDDVPPILVHPHPSEDRSTWANALAGLKKTRISVTPDPAPLIFSTVGTVTPGSTTALTAFVAGKPVFGSWPLTGMSATADAALQSMKIDELTAPSMSLIHQWSRAERPSLDGLSIVHAPPDGSSAGIARWFASKGLTAEVLEEGPGAIASRIVKFTRANLGRTARKWGVKREIDFYGDDKQIAPPSLKLPGGLSRADTEPFLDFVRTKCGLEFELGHLAPDLWCILPADGGCVSGVAS